jgi:hypothetical protein
LLFFSDEKKVSALKRRREERTSSGERCEAEGEGMREAGEQQATGMDVPVTRRTSLTTSLPLSIRLSISASISHSLSLLFPRSLGISFELCIYIAADYFFNSRPTSGAGTHAAMKEAMPRMAIL